MIKRWLEDTYISDDCSRSLEGGATLVTLSISENLKEIMDLS